MPEYLLGIDEAGLAPNLGPLVITATLWELPAISSAETLWDSFAGILSQKRTGDRNLLHVADSKQVHQASKGLANLERGVLSALALLDPPPQNLKSLWSILSPAGADEFVTEPWNVEQPQSIPVESDPSEIQRLSERWRNRCHETGIRLKGVRSEIVSTTRYNKLVEKYENKSIVLSKLSLGLIRNFWNPHSDDRCLIISDKHGGRNRYDELIGEIAGDEFIIRCEESTSCSTYRVRKSELRFQVGGEEHLPVAIASMISKYVREASLIPFNEFFRRRIPDLKPTKGYPVDAARFRSDVREIQRELGITDHQFWRCR